MDFHEMLNRTKMYAYDFHKRNATTTTTLYYDLNIEIISVRNHLQLVLIHVIF